MFRWKQKHREVPELNTTSTADISFMLLVFFLVTSSMDSDKGLGRTLSPVEEQQEQMDINRSNVLQIRLDENDVLYCDDKTVTLAQLQQQVESFVASRQTDRYILAVQRCRMRWLQPIARCVIRWLVRSMAVRLANVLSRNRRPSNSAILSALARELQNRLVVRV